MQKTSAETTSVGRVKLGLSEKRRLQNRVAQRKYRERMKARPEGVEDSRSSVELAQNDTVSRESRIVLPSTPHVLDTLDSIQLDNSQPIGDDLVFDELLSSRFDVDASSNDIYHSRREPSAQIDVPSAWESPILNSVYARTDVLDLDMNFDSYFDELSTIDLDFGRMGSSAETISGKPYERYIAAADPESKLTPTVRTRAPPNQPTFPCAVASGINGNTLASGIIQHLRLDHTNENKALVKTTLARGHNIRDVFLAGLAVLGKDDRQFNIPPPHPRKTTITFLRVSTLQAYMAIAASIGLELPEKKPHDWYSPFYRRRALLDGESNAIVTSHQKLPVCMRPTPAQIMYPHVAWVDVIPFPALRERIITEMIAQNPLLGDDEFKDDLFMRNGLFCWRSSEKGGSGQPWDMRSWEAEPWFLERWSWLLGGENDDVWQQTQWWRSMRGKLNMQA